MTSSALPGKYRSYLATITPELLETVTLTPRALQQLCDLAKIPAAAVKAFEGNKEALDQLYRRKISEWLKKARNSKRVFRVCEGRVAAILPPTTPLYDNRVVEKELVEQGFTSVKIEPDREVHYYKNPRHWILLEYFSSPTARFGVTGHGAMFQQILTLPSDPADLRYCVNKALEECEAMQRRIDSMQWDTLVSAPSRKRVAKTATRGRLKDWAQSLSYGPIENALDAADWVNEVLRARC